MQPPFVLPPCKPFSPIKVQPPRVRPLMGSDATVSPSRPRDLELSELDRSLPGIEADPAVADSATAQRGYGCPEANPPEKADGEERLEDFDEFYETCVEATNELERSIEAHIKKIRALNATLPEDQRFFPVIIVPRCPRLPIVADYLWEFSMDETSPTTLGSKRFTKPGHFGRYGATTMLQFFSFKFTGDFPSNQPMLVYGFVAVRDDVEPLRNYIFNLIRENPCEVKPVSPMVPLMCPARGMSVFFDSMIEYTLKVKTNGGDSTGGEDDVLIDGCIQFSEESIRRDRKLKSRIDGPFGPVDMEYAFIRRGIEAVVEITLIPKYFVGDRVKVTAFTSGYTDPVLLYDGFVRKRFKFSSVVAVSLGGQLKIKLEATIYNTEYEKEMVFTAQKYGSSKEKLELVDVPTKDEKYFRRREGRFVPKGHGHVVAVKVTWSTMGY